MSSSSLSLKQLEDWKKKRTKPELAVAKEALIHDSYR